MAIFHLQTKSISRGDGRSAIGAAAYRAGERIRDERTGVLHNYSRRSDVTHCEILLPSPLRGADLTWATQRASLWNAAEQAEPRRNARVAREYVVALPAELNAGQRLQLARAFSRELADRHNVAIDLAVHAPRAAGDARNHHAHLLATSREISAAGFGAKAGLDMASGERARRGLPVGIAEIKAVRQRWAVLSNQALAAAGLDARIDHRSLRAQGIDREPIPRIPFALIQMERRGVRSEIAERIRERYRARMEARRARLAERPEDAAVGRLDLAQLRRQARADWLQLRASAAPSPEFARPKQLAQSPEYVKESSQTPPPSLGQPPPQQLPAPKPVGPNPPEQCRAATALQRDALDRDCAL